MPHTRKWREYWDKQFYLFMTNQDDNALRHATVDVFHAVVKCTDNPASLASSVRCSDERAAHRWLSDPSER